MTIVLAWFLAILAMLGLGYLGYKVVISLPDLLVRYVEAREKIRRERLQTEKLEQEVLNEQFKAISED